MLSKTTATAFAGISLKKAASKEPDCVGAARTLSVERAGVRFRHRNPVAPRGAHGAVCHPAHDAEDRALTAILAAALILTGATAQEHLGARDPVSIDAGADWISTT
jgi:hypothetical protein